MGPRTERSAGQRTFLSLMLSAVVFLTSILKVIATASILPASVDSRSVGESVYFCFPIAPQDI